MVGTEPSPRAQVSIEDALGAALGSLDDDPYVYLRALENRLDVYDIGWADGAAILSRLIARAAILERLATAVRSTVNDRKPNDFRAILAELDGTA